MCSHRDISYRTRAQWLEFSSFVSMELGLLYSLWPIGVKAQHVKSRTRFEPRSINAHTDMLTPTYMHTYMHIRTDRWTGLMYPEHVLRKIIYDNTFRPKYFLRYFLDSISSGNFHFISQKL